MQHFLNKTVEQFLCAVPVKDLTDNSLNIQDLTWEYQEILINKTVLSKLVLEYPIKIDYQKTFIRYFVDKLEKNNCEVHDAFYTAYGQLVASGHSKSEYFKHYLIINSGTIISLRENINLISEGTTGLRTWQASLALAEWSLQHRQTLFQKNILELGSGIGLTSLVISLECQPKNVYFSDCHPSVLETLCDNIELNIKEHLDQNKNRTQVDSTVVLNKELNSGVNVSVLNLPWEEVDSTICKKIGDIDVILAADVVYDSDLFDPLINALTCISSNCKVQEIIFACTERNPDTLKEFLLCLGKHFIVEEEDCPNQENFIWCANPPVRFLKLSQS